MQKLIYPMKTIRFTQDFKGNSHKGIDLGGADGGQDFIYSCGDGEVLQYFRTAKDTPFLIIRYENVVGVDGKHYDHLDIAYLHCKEKYVKEGQKVTRGQKIALEGNEGYSFGNHLHLGVYPNYIRYSRGYIDPKKVLFLDEEFSTLSKRSIVQNLPVLNDEKFDGNMDLLFNMNLRAEPYGKILEVIPKEQDVRVLATYAHVVTADGNNGWIAVENYESGNVYSKIEE